MFGVNPPLMLGEGICGYREQTGDKERSYNKPEKTANKESEFSEHVLI
ncbi:MAG: hypothetical protein ABJZ55_07165 [Fuerstiella sp.]